MIDETFSKVTAREQHDDIMGAVHRGIVASKATESVFMGEFKNTLKQVEEYQKIQNGRTEKHSIVLEEHSLKLQGLKNSIDIATTKISTALWSFGITSGVIVLLIAVIYGNMVRDIQDTSINVKELTALVIRQYEK